MEPAPSIAAGFAVFGMGTDTGGSVRGPSSANGIVGLKPTLGLLSRDGIIPLALSFDTAGPMARSVYDVAAALGAMTGVDAADPATGASQGRAETDYAKFLKADALKGARIGVARDFFGADEDVDWVMDSALDAMRNGGRDHRGCAISEVAARCQGRLLYRGALARVRAADRGLPGDDSVRTTRRRWTR